MRKQPADCAVKVSREVGGRPTSSSRSLRFRSSSMQSLITSLRSPWLSFKHYQKVKKESGHTAEEITLLFPSKKFDFKQLGSLIAGVLFGDTPLLKAGSKISLSLHESESGQEKRMKPCIARTGSSNILPRK